jgi:uncharacterized protein (TIGR01777 family)
MRVVITGATGLIGRALVEELVQRGAEVVVLSRSPERAASNLPLVAAHHRFDPGNEVAPAAAFDGSDAIVHLAGETVAGRWTEAKKQAIRDSRVIGTRNLVDGLASLDERPAVLISASAIGFYGARGDEDVTENSGPGADFLATTAVEWEAEAARAMDLGMRVVNLRTGIVLGLGGGALDQMLLPFKLGLGGPLGDGRQWWSWIHIRDVVRMILAAIDEGWTGAYNVTAPHPERQGDFARILGRTLGRPAIIPAPAFAIRALFGEFSTELLNGKRILPERARNAGFEWEFPRLGSALADLVG